MNFVDLKKLKIDCRFKDGGKFPSHTEPHVQPELAQRNGIRWLPHSCLIDGVLSQVSETPHSFRNKIIFGHFSSSWKKTDKQKPANYWWLKCCQQIWFVNKFVKGVNLNISVRWTAGRCLTWWTRRANLWNATKCWTSVCLFVRELVSVPLEIRLRTEGGGGVEIRTWRQFFSYFSRRVMCVVVT